MNTNNLTRWTHISGMIRIDDLPLLRSDKDIERRLKDRFGITVDLDDEIGAWDHVNVPCGSDSSVQYQITVTRRGSSTAWGYVAVWGDLMDYDDVDAVVRWIKDSTDGLAIRSASVLIEVSGKDTYHLYYVWSKPDDSGSRTGKWKIYRLEHYFALTLAKNEDIIKQ